MVSKFYSKAPLRLGLGGGGTDIPSYFENFGGNVLNVTIDKFVYSTLITLDEKEIVFCALDLNTKIKFNLNDEIVIEGNLKLHKAVYCYMINNFNQKKRIPLSISTFCEAPLGSGLGSSSTIVVSLIKVMADFLSLNLDKEELAFHAFIIEREFCGLAGGKQDHYAAVFGGINFMEFNCNNRVIINKLAVNKSVVSQLESSLLLFSTSVSRDSSTIIEEQASNINLFKKEKLEAMHSMKKDAIKLKGTLINGDLEKFVEIFQESWNNKKKTSSLISNKYLDQIFNDAISSGALAGKISGAGGGGIMIFFVPLEKRIAVIKSLNKYSGDTSFCNFYEHGCKSWIINK